MSVHTRTDLFATRVPAETPRGRLRRSAALVAQADQEARRITAVDRDDVRRLRVLARRGTELLRGDESRGGRLVARLCDGLDRMAAATHLYHQADVSALCSQLLTVLTLLDAADHEVKSLRGELDVAKYDAGQLARDNDLLRGQLATEQARTANALQEVPAARWEEPTRACTVVVDHVVGGHPRPR